VRYGKTTGLAEERRRNGVIGEQPLFHFLFTVFLYNLWILLRILVNISFGRKKKKSPITAFVFGKLFLSGDYG